MRPGSSRPHESPVPLGRECSSGIVAIRPPTGIISTVIPQGTVAELMEMLDQDRSRLRSIVTGKDSAALSSSSNGKWSVIENLRHILFFEQSLGRFTSANVAFSPLGYPPPGLWKRFPGFQFAATPTAAEVIAEWDAAHSAIRDSFTRDDDEVRLALGKAVRHLRGHIRQIESALRARQ